MAGRFDPTKYETVKQRKDRLIADNEQPVILAVPRGITSDEACFTVGVWRDREQMIEGAERLATALSGGTQIGPDVAMLLMCPDSLGTAYEAKWMAGASQTSWTENAEESAIGRALDNLGYHGGGKCSREEILKALEAEQQLKSPPPENPFGSADLDLTEFDDRPRVHKFLTAWKGKRGVNEWKDLFHRAFGLGWDEDKLIAWALTKGVDLANGAKAADAITLNAHLLREVKA